jgi:hypothetical protein
MKGERFVSYFKRGSRVFRSPLGYDTCVILDQPHPRIWAGSPAFSVRMR